MEMAYVYSTFFLGLRSSCECCCRTHAILTLSDAWIRVTASHASHSSEDASSVAEIGIRLSDNLLLISRVTPDLSRIVKDYETYLRGIASEIIEDKEDLLARQITEKIRETMDRDPSHFYEALQLIPEAAVQERKNVSIDVSKLYQNEELSGDRVSQAFACNVAAGVAAGGILTGNIYLTVAAFSFAYGAGC